MAPVLRFTRTGSLRTLSGFVWIFAAMKQVACIAALVIAAQLWVIALLGAAGAAPRRLALVVGNSAYTATAPLPNASNDARLFSKFLERQGFEVETLTDVSRGELGRGLQAFSDKIQGGDVALFYYAGHGMQMDGQNFLLGVDARLETSSMSPPRRLRWTRSSRRWRCVPACR